MTKKLCLHLCLLLLVGLIYKLTINIEVFQSNTRFKLPVVINYHKLPWKRQVESKISICKDVFEMTRTVDQSISLSTAGKLHLQKIADSKTTNKFIPYDYYENLAKLLPATLMEAKTQKGKNFIVDKKTRLELLNWKIPFLNCHLTKYEHKEFSSCLTKKLNQSETVYISFIGDSRIRLILELLLEVCKNFGLSIITSKGDKIVLEDFLGKKGLILWPKYKENLTVKSSVFPNLIITFFWAPLLSKGDEETEIPYYNAYQKSELFSDLFYKKIDTLPIANEDQFIKEFESRWSKNATVVKSIFQIRKNGAFDEFHRLAKKSHLPDYIIIDSSLWELKLNNEEVLKNIDEGALTIWKKLYPILETLSTRTNVIVVLPIPLKSYLSNANAGNFFSLLKNSNLEWYLNAQFQMLPKNVIKWDSFLPFTIAANNDCHKLMINKNELKKLPIFKRFNAGDSYRCRDINHQGMKNVDNSVQMLLNHICNPVTKFSNEDKQYCCNH